MSQRDEYDDYDDSALHEDCVPRDEVVAYAEEKHPDELEDVVRERWAQRWLTEGVWLQLLNTVSVRDTGEFREAVRQTLEGRGPGAACACSHGRGVHTAGGVCLASQCRCTEFSSQPEPDLFAIASEAARLLESAGSPYAERCQLGEDLEWLRNVLKVTRAFRQILGALPAGKGSWSARHGLTNLVEGRGLTELTARLLKRERERLRALNDLSEVLSAGVVSTLEATWVDGEQHFVRKTDKNPIHVLLAAWIEQYLTEHRSHLDLGVCAECSRIFERARKDNVYCSRTCQNRVAYKRKRILEAGVLREVKVNLGEWSKLKAGLWLYHPRLGLGFVESCEYVPGVDVKVAGRPHYYESVIDVLLDVRFPSTVQTLRLVELLGKEGDSVPTFHAVREGTRLLELL